MECAWAVRSGLKACIYTCAQMYASVCVYVSDLPVPLHITEVTRVDGMAYPWFTCDAQRPHLFSCGQGWLAQDANQKLPSTKGSCLTCFCPMVGHATYYHGSLWVCVFRPRPGPRAILNSASPLPAPVESAEAPVDFLLVVYLYLRAHLSSLASYLKS